MLDWRGRKIVVIVSGGIAAYKTAELVSRLKKDGAEVRVVMTRAACQFVTPLTFETLSGQPVYRDVFEQPSSWEMDHIAWARWADAAIVAPATANTLAKMAQGLADDAATTLLLAYQGPVWVVPAMNSAMWSHPATQHNLKLLAERGVHVIQPGSGRLACGEVGAGRMAEPEAILHTIELAETIGKPGGPAGAAAGEGGARAARTSWLAGRRVLVTAGPTQEALDAIRFLSNRSSGRMGVALAAEAHARGAKVTLVHGPLRTAAPEGIAAVAVRSAREMLGAVERQWAEVDLAVFAAAVANYEAAAPEAGKLKGGESLRIELRRTPDIARWAGEHRREGQVLVGFAAESENMEAEAARKLAEKKLDLICANPIGEPGVGFDEAANKVTLLTRDGKRLHHARAPKAEVAAWIWNQVEAWARGTENACQKQAKA
jgi:phosphopantothenoylcysteine decarboxylase/phosphopantothenate--cysteine ligase